MTPTIALLQETLTDLTKKKQYHESILSDINEKIQSHENALKIIEDAT